MDPIRNSGASSSRRPFDPRVIKTPDSSSIRTETIEKLNGLIPSIPVTENDRQLQEGELAHLLNVLNVIIQNNVETTQYFNYFVKQMTDEEESKVIQSCMALAKQPIITKELKGALVNVLQKFYANQKLLDQVNSFFEESKTDEEFSRVFDVFSRSNELSQLLANDQCIKSLNSLLESKSNWDMDQSTIVKALSIRVNKRHFDEVQQLSPKAVDHLVTHLKQVVLNLKKSSQSVGDIRHPASPGDLCTQPSSTMLQLASDVQFMVMVIGAHIENLTNKIDLKVLGPKLLEIKNLLPPDIPKIRERLQSICDQLK